MFQTYFCMGIFFFKDAFTAIFGCSLLGFCDMDNIPATASRVAGLSN